MTQDVQWIRKALIQRKEYDALQKEIETLRIELLAADYEAEHASGWFTAKKKQALIEKRDILQARLSPLEKNLQGLSPASLRSLADQDVYKRQVTTSLIMTDSTVLFAKR